MGVKKIIVRYQIILATSHMMIIWPDQTWPVTKRPSSRGPIKASLVLFYFGLAELLQHDNCFMKIQWQKNFGFASFKAQYYSQKEWKCSIWWQCDHNYHYHILPWQMSRSNCSQSSPLFNKLDSDNSWITQLSKSFFRVNRIQQLLKHAHRQLQAAFTLQSKQ